MSKYRDEVVVTHNTLNNMKNGIEYVAVNWEELQKSVAYIKSVLSEEQYQELKDNYNFDSAEMALVKKLNPSHKMRYL